MADGCKTGTPTAKTICSRSRRAAGLSSCVFVCVGVLGFTAAGSSSAQPTAPPTQVPVSTTTGAPSPSGVPRLDLPPVGTAPSLNVTVDGIPPGPNTALNLLITGVIGLSGTLAGAWLVGAYARTGRKEDRKVAYLDGLEESVGELDEAYADAQHAEYASAQSARLAATIRSFERATGMVHDAETRRLATEYHSKLQSYWTTVGDETPDPLDEDVVVTQQELSNANIALVDRIRKVIEDAK